ncbi:hypothetical protein RPMA_07920 [Tardiphaga alba]|uniref:Uncharacterized protein n=1 Tax=Tardiphaga alba TaxID=340268 RepID=A0ABX8AAE8_9BRAD|nr:hypothetical protein [Tardiphaga alba]QUS38765.1 hypothetical protein RPMA_07920 [Tardiphaga alba]
MSEHKPDSNSDVHGDHVGNDAMAAGSHMDSPNLAPGQGEGPRGQMPRKDAPRLGAPHRLTIMAPSRDGAQREDTKRERSWEDLVNSEPRSEQAEKPGTARMLAIAAMIAIGITVGAVGGSMATNGLGKLFAADDGKAAATHALEEHITRLETEVAVLKADADKANKATAAARAKFNDRLDKLEKAQAEPNAKIAKLNEAVEKLRTAPPPAPAAAPAPAPAPVASVPAKDVTGSINNATPAPKPEVARLPTVDGWRILDVAGGGATIESRQGVFEVYPGDPVPGLGRVDAVRKQDGRWTVVTSRGLIVAR